MADVMETIGQFQRWRHFRQRPIRSAWFERERASAADSEHLATELRQLLAEISRRSSDPPCFISPANIRNRWVPPPSPSSSDFQDNRLSQLTRWFEKSSQLFTVISVCWWNCINRWSKEKSTNATALKCSITYEWNAPECHCYQISNWTSH